MPNATVLLGNHEKMMLDALRESNDSREELRLWYENGGKITHIDYYALEADEQAAIVEYIRQMPLAAEVTVNGRAYLLVQGAPPELYGRYRPTRKTKGNSPYGQGSGQRTKCRMAKPSSSGIRPPHTTRKTYR